MALKGGMLPGATALEGYSPTTLPPVRPVNRLTEACDNITFAQLLLRAVQNSGESRTGHFGSFLKKEPEIEKKCWSVRWALPYFFTSCVGDFLLRAPVPTYSPIPHVFHSVKNSLILLSLRDTATLKQNPSFG